MASSRTVANHNDTQRLTRVYVNGHDFVEPHRDQFASNVWEASVLVGLVSCPQCNESIVLHHEDMSLNGFLRCEHCRGLWVIDSLEPLALSEPEKG